MKIILAALVSLSVAQVFAEDINDAAKNLQKIADTAVKNTEVAVVASGDSSKAAIKKKRKKIAEKVDAAKIRN